MVGGNEVYLNPAVIYVSEDGSAGFERCQTEKYERREIAVGDFLDDKFIVCGGWGKDYVNKNDCEVLDETGTQKFKMLANGRRRASSIKLNQSSMLITGGYDSDYHDLKSTEFITVNGPTVGVNLPFTVYGHCMIQYQEDAIILIGGEQEGKSNSDKTWIIDPTNGFNITEGPSLKEGRWRHSCGKMKDEYGNVLVVVAGGYKRDSVEVLNTTLMKEWVYG